MIWFQYRLIFEIIGIPEDFIFVEKQFLMSLLLCYELRYNASDRGIITAVQHLGLKLLCVLLSLDCLFKKKKQFFLFFSKGCHNASLCFK